jgi:hypothetical protein
VGGLFKRTNTFGMSTPYDVAGRAAKKVVGSWRSCSPDSPFVSKLYADHLDFRYPKLGKPQDQQCVRQMKGEGYTKIILYFLCLFRFQMKISSFFVLGSPME